MPVARPFNFLTVQRKLLKLFQNEEDTCRKNGGIPDYKINSHKLSGTISDIHCLMIILTLLLVSTVDAS